VPDNSPSKVLVDDLEAQTKDPDYPTLATSTYPLTRRRACERGLMLHVPRTRIHRAAPASHAAAQFSSLDRNPETASGDVGTRNLSVKTKGSSAKHSPILEG